MGYEGFWGDMEDRVKTPVELGEHAVEILAELMERNMIQRSGDILGVVGEMETLDLSTEQQFAIRLIEDILRGIRD